MPRLCKPIKAIIAISEPPAELYLRQMKKADNIWGGQFFMHSWQEIDLETYMKCARYNPTNEGYFALLLEDYSEVLK